MWVRWNLVLVCLEIVLISAQDRFTVCAECTIGSKIALGTPEGTPRWRRSSGSPFESVLGIVSISTQDRCMVCSERTLGSEIILTLPMVLLGDVGQVKVCFSPFRDSVNLGTRLCTVCNECTTSMETISAHPMVHLGDVGKAESCFGLFGDSVNLSAR
jgi:hypothetical protein